MKPKIIHQKAMEYSFRAKKAVDELDYASAFNLFKLAADLESQVAEFYFDKPDLEPTRSVIIRSAAFLNLKAGLIENAQKFILFGLLNTNDEFIKCQLNDALELSVSLRNMTPNSASSEFTYLNLLRQRSIHYVLEPSSVKFGNSVSLEMIKDFTDNYLKSLKAYAIASFKRTIEIADHVEDALKEFEQLINPLLTNSAYGSFKFSIANDFLGRVGEKKDVVKLKANIISKYHYEIFINPLADSDIVNIKAGYDEDEINQIFRPLTKIKANNTPYKIGYYDTHNFNKVFVKKIVNNQRKKLLPIKKISQEDIGELESSIIHKRSSKTGKISTKTIFKEQLKSYEFDIKTNQIEPKGKAPLLLNEEILLNVNFNSENGFKYSFDDFQIEYTDIEYERGLEGFYSHFYDKIIHIVNLEEKEKQGLKDWNVIKKLIGNPDALRK